MKGTAEDIGRALIRHCSVNLFDESLPRIRTCLAYLSEDEIWHRPNDRVASVRKTRTTHFDFGPSQRDVSCFQSQGIVTGPAVRRSQCVSFFGKIDRFAYAKAIMI